MDKQSLFNELELFRQASNEYISDALYFWANEGYDSRHGGYYEAVDFNGKPLKSLNRRFRVHPRNIFTHAAATEKGYGNYLDTAIQASSYILDKCWQKDQGFATLSDKNGTIIDNTIMLYDQSFVLLAFAWLYKVCEKIEYKHDLIKIWNTIKNTLALPKVGFATSNVAAGKKKYSILQNPHMHLFEALLDIYKLTKDEYWLEEAGKIYSLILGHFYSREYQVIVEYLNDDYNPQKDSFDKIEPGHHLEWIWLLVKYDGIVYDSIDTNMLEGIYQFAIKNGLSKLGVPFEMVSRDGTPVKSTQRMWAQTELIKAQLAMYEYSDDIVYLALALESMQTLFTYFCSHKKPGIWHDSYDIQGNMVSKQSPASTLYHLFVAIDEFNRVSSDAMYK